MLGDPPPRSRLLVAQPPAIETAMRADVPRICETPLR